MSPNEENERLVLETYKLYLDDVNKLRESRQALNNLHVTVVTVLLGAQAFMVQLLLAEAQSKDLKDPDFRTWIPVLAIMAIGFIGFTFCSNWKHVVVDTTTSIRFKFNNLELMEKSSEVLRRAQAQLFVREREERDKTSQLQTTRRSRLLRWLRVKLIMPIALLRRTSSQKSGTPTPKRGVGKRAIELADFFNGLFRALSIGAPIFKLGAVFGLGTWITATLLPQMSHWLASLPR